MSEHDDLERMLLKVSERRIEALERELDRKLSRLWRVHADLSPDLTPRPPSLTGKGDQAPPGPFVLPPSAARCPVQTKSGRGGAGGGVFKIALALAGLAAVFVSAWLYDLSRSDRSAAGLVVLDERFDRPQLVFRGPGDPAVVTRQLAGRPAFEELKFVEPGPNTGVFRFDGDPVLGVTSKGNWFRIEGSEIVKRAPTGEESVIVSGLDRPMGLALDPEGNLLVFEGGTGRILRVEAVDGELKPGSPVSVLAVVQLPREERSTEKPEETLKLGLGFMLQDLVAGPVYLTVNERGEIFVGERTDNGKAVVYKIARKGFQWWKFYCLYRC
jgi:hypothetical protein